METSARCQNGTQIRSERRHPALNPSPVRASIIHGLLPLLRPKVNLMSTLGISAALPKKKNLNMRRFKTSRTKQLKNKGKAWQLGENKIRSFLWFANPPNPWRPDSFIGTLQQYPSRQHKDPRGGHGRHPLGMNLSLYDRIDL